MSKTFVLKENNELVRQRILQAGIKVCVCARFANSCWLEYRAGLSSSVHGVGFATEDSEDQATVLNIYEHDNSDAFYCACVDEFIAMIKEYDKKDEL